MYFLTPSQPLTMILPTSYCCCIWIGSGRFRHSTLSQPAPCDIATLRLLLYVKRERTKSQGFCYQNQSNTRSYTYFLASVILIASDRCCYVIGRGNLFAFVYGKQAISVSLLIFYASRSLFCSVLRAAPVVNTVSSRPYPVLIRFQHHPSHASCDIADV